MSGAKLYCPLENVINRFASVFALASTLEYPGNGVCKNLIIAERMILGRLSNSYNGEWSETLLSTGECDQ